jgi:hypothetical protein
LENDMAERDIDIVIRAKAITAAAFAQVEKELESLSSQTTRVGKDADAAGKGLGSFGGSLSSAFSAAGMVLGAAAGGVVALGAGIVALGTRGAEVADIKDSFDIMNKSIGQDGAKSLAALDSAFMGTVPRFDLMKASNKALSLGVKLTAEEFGMLGKGARILADRTGGDATDALEKLTMAMATGKMGAIQKMGVDAEAGGVIRELTRMVREQGEAQFDFQDAIDASKGFVVNFKDSLAVAVAQSPVVNAMLASFGKGLQASFGADQAGLVKVLIGYVNQFAIKLVDVVDYALAGAGFMGKAFSGLQAVFALVNGAVLGVGATFNEMVASSLELATKIPGLGDSFKGAAWQARDLANQTKGMADSFKDQYKEALEGIKGNTTYGKTIESMRGGLTTMRGEMVKALNSTADLTGSTNAGANAFVSARDEVKKLTKEDIAAEKAKVKLREEMDRFSKGISNMWKDGIIPTASSVKQLHDHFSMLEKDMTIAGSSVLNLTGMWRELPKPIKSTGEASKEAADKHQAATDSMKASLASLADAFALVAQTSKGSLGEVAQWMGTVITTGNLAVKGSDTLKQGWGQLSGEGKNVVAGLTSIAAGAMSVYAAMMQATDGTNKTKNALSGAFAGAQAGAMFGPWGTAIGAVGGAIFGLFRSGSNASAKAAKEMAEQQAKLAAEIKAANDKLLADLQSQLAAAKTDFEGLTSKAKDMGYVFDEAGKLVGVRFDKMKEAADKYGLGLPDLGTKFNQAQLHDKAMAIVNDFELLDKGGANVGGTIFAMKDKIQAVVDESKKYGIDIPGNMKPMINALIEGGHLTDDQGNKLKDMAGIKFGDQVKSQFDTIQEGLLGALNKMNELLAAILAIPTNKKVTVETHHVTTGDADGSGGGDSGGGDGGGGGGYDGYDYNGDGRNENGYSNGGVVHAPLSGMGVRVHGREGIVPLDKPSLIGRQFAAEVLTIGRSVDAGPNIRQEITELRAAINSLANSNRNLPDALARSVRDGNLQMGGGRR